MNEIQPLISKIKTLPKRPPFMLDSDVAMAYGTTAKRINEAVRRNPERFPEDFVFRLTKREAEACGIEFDFKVADCDLKDMRGRHRKYRPYGFTREGCNMLATVLRTPVAVDRSVQIIRAFSAMEKGEAGAMSLLKDLAVRLSEMDERLRGLEGQSPVNIDLPDDTALPIAIERKRAHSSNFQKGLKYPEVRALALRLRREGRTFDEVRDAIRATWPDDPEKWVSRSAVARFWQNARSGRLKEFGIDVTVH